MGRPLVVEGAEGDAAPRHRVLVPVLPVTWWDGRGGVGAPSGLDIQITGGIATRAGRSSTTGQEVVDRSPGLARVGAGRFAPGRRTRSRDAGGSVPTEPRIPPYVHHRAKACRLSTGNREPGTGRWVPGAGSPRPGSSSRFPVPIRSGDLVPPSRARYAPLHNSRTRDRRSSRQWPFGRRRRLPLFAAPGVSRARERSDVRVTRTTTMRRRHATT